MEENSKLPIIILCEQPFNSITNNEASYSSLQGIAYAKYLRRVEKKRNPIIFTSFLSPDQLLDKPNTRIITAIGHGYLQIPYTELQLQEVIYTISPLNDIQLNDIIINFCQLRSAVRESFHIFKGKLREIKGSLLSNKHKTEKYKIEFKNYEKNLLKDASAYPLILIEFRRLVTDFQDTSRIEMITEVTEEQFSRFLPPDSDEVEYIDVEPKPWKILFLDDKPSELQDIFKEIENRKISYQVATSSVEAKNVVENDKLNLYTVIVSDYRLFESKSEWKEPRMQAEQGYDFLLWLSQKHRFYSMIALSGLSKWFLMESFRKHQVNVKVYSKNNVLTENGARLFVDDLEYLGDRQYEVLCNQPKAKLWHEDTEKAGKITNYALKPYYIYHRNHPTYESVEKELNIIAEKVAREIEYALDEKGNNFAPIISAKGNALTNMKGKIVDEYEVFQLKLLYRRIFYYLTLKGFHRDAISRLLHRGDTDSEKDMSEQLIKQIPYYLGIQTEGDIPYWLLVEEVYFLQHYMNLPLYEAAKMMDQTYVIFNDYINRYLPKKIEAKEELARYVCRGDIKAVSINEAHIILNKMAVILDPNLAQKLVDEIEEVISILSKGLSKFKLLEDSAKKIEELRTKISKKIAKS